MATKTSATQTAATTTPNTGKGKDKSKSTAASTTTTPATTTDAPASGEEPPAATLSPEQERAKMIEDKKREIQARIDARKRKEEEDLANLQLLEQGQLPPERVRGTGVMSIVELNKIGANARAAHRAIEALDDLSTDVEAQTPDFKITKDMFIRLRDRAMSDFNSKEDERRASGAMMKGLLPLALKRDDKGNVIKEEHIRTKGGKNAVAEATPASA